MPRPTPAAGLLLPLLSLILAAAPTHANAQVRASERASVTQTVDGTVITVEYARPVARGRSDLFGGVVHWGEVWTPGANDATVLEIDKDIRLAGHEVPAGRWSIWMVVAEKGPWELVLDPRDSLFHTQPPKPADDQVRFEIERVSGEPMEVLTWWFPEIRQDGATLTMGWGTVRVPLGIEVTPSYSTVVAAEEAERYVGEWEIRMGGKPEPAADGPPPIPYTLRYHDSTSTLRGDATFPGPEGPQPVEMMLLPRAEGVFGLGIVRDGELFETLSGYLEFELDGSGVVDTFVMRNDEDVVFMRGSRKP